MRGKPVILSLAYYQCPMLCTLVLNGLTSAMRALPFDAGNEFDVITVSFDPKDTPELAAKKKATYLEEYRREGAANGWHFLTGDEASIKQLTDGGRASATTTCRTRAVRPCRRHHGVDTGRHPVALLLRRRVRAARSQVRPDGSRRPQRSARRSISCCCSASSYDPSTGRYTNTVMTAIRIGAVLTVLVLGAMIFGTWRRDRAKATPAAADGAGRPAARR